MLGCMASTRGSYTLVSVPAVEEPLDVPLARPHQLLHAVAEEPGAQQVEAHLRHVPAHHHGLELGPHAALVPDTLLGSGNAASFY